MKKLLLVCLVAMFGAMNAQENVQVLGNTGESGVYNGAWWIMGQLQYKNSEASDTSSFTIMPIVGTFISPTVTVGAGVGYTNSKTGDNDAVDSFKVMPLARKYWELSNKFYIFGQAAVPMTFSDNVNTFGFQLSPGIDYYFTNHFSLEATFGALGYTNVSSDEGNSYGETSIGFDSTDLRLGLKYTF